jgi:hypothetical protein
LIYFTIQISAYGVVFYLPARIAEMTGQSIGTNVGILTAIPWLCALLSMSPITSYADATRRHRTLGMGLLALTAGGLIASTLCAHIVPALIAFSVATVGFIAVQPLFWTLPTAYLSGTAAAAGIALIGSIGNLGGFIAPTLKTAAEGFLENPNAGTVALAFAGLLGMLLMSGLKSAHEKAPVSAL